MNDQEKLMQFIEWLGTNVQEFSGMKPEQIASQINEMSKSDEGKRTLSGLVQKFEQRNMTQHKNGGKVEYLKCLKKGGSIKDCGCGKKMPKAKEGEDDTSDWKEVRGRQITHRGNLLGNTVFLIESAGKRGPVVSSVSQNRKGERKYMTGNDWFRRKPENVDSAFVNRTNSLIEDYLKMIPTKTVTVPVNQDGGNIIRKQMRQGGADNKGYNRAQVNMAYTNAKNALRNKGMRGAEMRQAARRMVAGLSPMAQTITSNYDMPITTVNSDYTPTSISAPAAEVQGRLRSHNMTGFDGAFARSRERGLSEFIWNNNRYTTQTADDLAKNSYQRDYSMPTASSANPETLNLTKVAIADLRRNRQLSPSMFNTSERIIYSTNKK